MVEAVMSVDNILKELSYYNDNTVDIVDFLEQADELFEMIMLTEAEYEKATKRLKLDILDIEKYVEVNNCKCVTDARAFSSNNIPSPGGLVSNEIFGYTMVERAGTYGYIDLHGWFMDPSCYKTWIRLDPRIRNIVHGVTNFSLGDTGELIEDENGDTGIEFLRKNIKKIKFRDSESKSKQISLKYLEQNRNNMFIQKYIVIPPFYRDKNTDSSSRRTVGLGGINKIYTNLIVASNALTATQDFGFEADDAMKGRVQEIILSIYDWFCGNTNKAIAASEQGQGLAKKTGILKRVAMSKTTNFSTRMVISAADLKVNTPNDLMVTFDKSAIPLYALITQFRDFIMYHARLFFENEFRGINSYPVMTKSGKLKTIIPESPEVNFSDEKIKQEMDRFLHGYNNRFVPIEVPVEGSNEKYYMQFKGRGVDPNEAPISDESIYNRRLTWCDIFYIAAVEATKDKHVLVTRFPIDFFSNQFTTGIEVASTLKTECIEYNNQVYKFYPMIRESDIGKDTSNMFRDTMVFSNTYLAGCGGDYDGDTVTCKGVYTREANEELHNMINSKVNYITNGGSPLREPGSDVYQSSFALTRILSTVNVTPSSKIEYK